MNESGFRFLILKPYTKFDKTPIIASEEVRSQHKKEQFNENYFSELGNT